MLTTLDDVLRIGATIYRDQLPPTFRRLEAVRRVRDGEAIDLIVPEIRSTAKHLQKLCDEPDPVGKLLGHSLVEAASDNLMQRAKQMLGQLLVGKLAERAFEKTYRETMGTHEIRLEDDRTSRTDTDYRVLNGQNRPVFRINIKFHAARFKQAPELVGLQPDDCFALATYKIRQALDKQDREHLNYIFVIVGVPELTGANVGTIFQEDFVHLAATVTKGGKRQLEERIVDYVLDDDRGSNEVKARVAAFAAKIESAEWRVLSARKAFLLLHEKLFERVFALKVKNFTRSYRNAEVDMHFSLEQELTPLLKFLETLRERGLHGISNFLERGTF